MILHWVKSNLAGATPKPHDITLGKLEIPRGQLGQKNHILEASLYKDTHPSRQVKYRERSKIARLLLYPCWGRGREKQQISNRFAGNNDTWEII